MFLLRQNSKQKCLLSRRQANYIVLSVFYFWQHANIVKFHKFWTDTRSEKPRVIFITEYMTSGSLKQFLKKTRKSNYKTLNEKVSVSIFRYLMLFCNSFAFRLNDQMTSQTGLQTWRLDWRI